MIDLIVLAAGLPGLDDQALLAAHRGKPLYRHSFEAARQTADAMLGLRVTVVTRPGVLDEAIRDFGFNKVVVSANRPLSQAVIAGAKAARSGASRCVCPLPAAPAPRPEGGGGRLRHLPGPGGAHLPLPGPGPLRGGGDRPGKGPGGVTA